MTQVVVDCAARLRAAVVPFVRELRRQGNEPFSPTHLSVLGSIHRHGPLSLGELAVRERLSLPTISRVIDNLEGSGLVGRSQKAGDRRVCLVGTTASGEEWIEAGIARRNAWLASRLACLDDSDRSVLAAAVEVLERILEGD